MNTAEMSREVQAYHGFIDRVYGAPRRRVQLGNGPIATLRSGHVLHGVSFDVREDRSYLHLIVVPSLTWDEVTSRERSDPLDGLLFEVFDGNGTTYRVDGTRYGFSPLTHTEGNQQDPLPFVEVIFQGSPQDNVTELWLRVWENHIGFQQIVLE